MKTIKQEMKHYDRMVKFSQKITGNMKYSILPGMDKYMYGKFKRMFNLTEL